MIFVFFFLFTLLCCYLLKKWNTFYFWSFSVCSTILKHFFLCNFLCTVRAICVCVLVQIRTKNNNKNNFALQQQQQQRQKQKKQKHLLAFFFVGHSGCSMRFYVMFGSWFVQKCEQSVRWISCERCALLQLLCDLWWSTPWFGSSEHFLENHPTKSAVVAGFFSPSSKTHFFIDDIEVWRVRGHWWKNAIQNEELTDQRKTQQTFRIESIFADDSPLGSSNNFW